MVKIHDLRNISSIYLAKKAKLNNDLPINNNLTQMII